MKKIRIGLFGAILNNNNMGCCALTYSLLSMLERIGSENELEFTYLIFERNADPQVVNNAAKLLNIDSNRMISEKSARFIRFYETKTNGICRKKIKSCDFVIDLTQGDSFTDIYGMGRFISYSMDKLNVEFLGVPLILGPQTYGPFKKRISRAVAKFIINHSKVAFARDKLSYEYLKDVIKAQGNIKVVTDLAFGLPYKQGDKITKGCIGFNPSGLLWPNKIEATKTEFMLSCKYDSLCDCVIEELIKRKYEVHLISHVRADVAVCQKLHEKYPETVMVAEFESPMEAKSYISSMDAFIGSRMHATIAALSSGIPVLPVAYSRKFEGLFNNLRYPYCIDLLTMNNDNVIEYLVNWLNELSEAQEYINQSHQIIDSIYSVMESQISDEIISCI